MIADEDRCEEAAGYMRRERCRNRARWHVKLLPGGFEGDMCGVHAGPYQRAQRYGERYGGGHPIGRTIVTPIEKEAKVTK